MHSALCHQRTVNFNFPFYNYLPCLPGDMCETLLVIVQERDMSFNSFNFSPWYFIIISRYLVWNVALWTRLSPSARWDHKKKMYPKKIQGFRMKNPLKHLDKFSHHQDLEYSIFTPNSTYKAIILLLFYLSLRRENI